jgi:hypothetical protein
MKTLRLLMVGVLVLLVAATAPATAQAAGQFVGYLPLLSRVDPNLPVQVQSQRALSRIMPKLLALQKDGAVVEFEPELSIGVLKVKYSAVSQLSALAGIQTYANIRDAMVNVPRVQGVTQSASGPSFLAELYSSCFDAANLGAFSHVVGSLRDKTGRVVANYEGDADGSGYIDYYNRCFSWNGSYSAVVPGYKLTFKVYDTTPTLLGTFAVFAPSINLTTFDKANAIVGGTGPVGKPYSISWFHPNLDAGNTVKNPSMSGTISSVGKWSKDFGATTFRGGDEFSIFVQQNAQFTFLHTQNAPAIYCQLGSNYCDLSGIPFQPAKLSIIHNGVTYTFLGKFDSCGCFSQVLENNGNPIFLKAGDKISGTSVPVYALPNLIAAINFNTDVVSGKAPANRYFELWVGDLCSCNSYFIWSHSNSLGNYSGNFSSQIDLDPAHAVYVEVFYYDSVRGNITDYYRSVGP